MNTKTQHMERRLEKHLQSAAITLPKLEQEISHIGGFVHDELQGRLHHVEVMVHALRRNYREVIRSEQRPLAQRVRNLRRLYRLIEKESRSLQQEVEFLSMGSASAIISLVEGASALINQAFQVLKKTIPHGLRHPRLAR